MSRLTMIVVFLVMFGLWVGPPSVSTRRNNGDSFYVWLQPRTTFKDVAYFEDGNGTGFQARVFGSYMPAAGYRRNDGSFVIQAPSWKS